MRIATWNVNSIRARSERVVDWLERHDVDVLAIQETKCTDEKFPAMGFAAAGYELATVGLNQWNGVAIASRVGIADVAVGFPGQPGFSKSAEVPAVVEARAIGATCAGVRVWSLYIPNGRDLTDPHYVYKLEWLAALRDAGAAWLAADPDAQIALTGDWNIAPTDDDVWDPAYFADKTHTSPAERAAFDSVVEAGFGDVVRPFTPGPGVFTYWDYTQLRFARREGMRIDFSLCSPALAARVTGAEIDRQERKGKGASDHAPVIIDVA
ncbi:exodeoxyribonuclease III [Williamsia phyllosphaerae]|uniref:Exodeoxyribonuclease III protein XthA n=1 Tax=Williamsia phyllosphaerae TaxID=885042 RepID=A0ABQ1U3M0_9NOCA|nr:exodeoxyribonuclease III [Williamsia phyllosphaerae]GGF09847.1 putative exodeoxyribonuclease III protein XthA [Williamsia phyllosphaerae]